MRGGDTDGRYRTPIKGVKGYSKLDYINVKEMKGCRTNTWKFTKQKWQLGEILKMMCKEEAEKYNPYTTYYIEKYSLKEDN